MEQLFVFGSEVLEEAGGNSCRDGPLMLNLILERGWEGGGVRENKKDIPVYILREERVGGYRCWEDYPSDYFGYCERGEVCFGEGGQELCKRDREGQEMESACRHDAIWPAKEEGNK